MKKALLLPALAAVAAFLIAALPAAAVTHGSLDGNAHPYVGLMVAKDASGTPLWRCSGTLISPTVFVTAGHCTEAPAATAEIWWDSDVQSNAAALGYPFTGESSGVVHQNPLYDGNDFSLWDVGVVTLNAPVTNLGYGQLPAENSLAGLKVNSKTTFTAVGYGLQRAFPDQGHSSVKDEELKIRMVAYPHLISVGWPQAPNSLILSDNAKTGGTCFGDSGGPNFLGDSNVVAGVTSFGKSWVCGGQGGVMRLDLPQMRNWVLSFVGP
ncbi:MAG TPA: trypsin-like serine protease [Gaiellaceae bacterium]|nr:trypsin-like serine protease [Gaiellaceae bacterium]